MPISNLGIPIISHLLIFLTNDVIFNSIFFSIRTHSKIFKGNHANNPILIEKGKNIGQAIKAGNRMKCVTPNGLSKSDSIRACRSGSKYTFLASASNSER